MLHQFMRLVGKENLIKVSHGMDEIPRRKFLMSQRNRCMM